MSVIFRPRIGTAVKLSPCDYPQYRGHVGILVSEEYPDQWKVFIKGKVHPYFVHRINLLRPEVVK